ncbi:MAG: 50S ribosomal protein L21 [Gammaproteobacteria bacterium]|nr:50S ribosomal protein L21 [Gammaproteobacteria bacterium]MCH9743590.1 50S ribosomal protein L21 [Gammaproteobacteria bacterium]
MYAIVKTGGKQYKVAPGDIIKLEKLTGEAGQAVEFNEILMVSDDNNQIKMGKPFIKGAKVKGEVVEQGRLKKVHILKFRRRKHHMKRMGHRQSFTAVKITDIAA